MHGTVRSGALAILAATVIRALEVPMDTGAPRIQWAILVPAVLKSF